MSCQDPNSIYTIAAFKVLNHSPSTAGSVEKVDENQF